jgi:hypothetical protein
MRTFLARCGTLGLLCGGFALTGDAGWVISRGTSLLNATSFPTPASDAAATVPPSPADEPPVARQPVVETLVNPTLAAPTVAPPADGGLTAVDLRLLHTGDRVVIWAGGMPTVFDIVDPAVGGAIQQPQSRRVTLTGAGDQHRIVRGGTVHVQPLAGVSGHAAAAERLGPVQAIAVK